MFPSDIEGDIIICRECLIDGPVEAESKGQFYDLRSEYLSKTYPEVKESYFEKVVAEFEKLDSIKKGDEVNLWFEDDLFCQTNMWFVLTLLKNKSKEIKLYRVFPVITNQDEKWNGFGYADVQSLIQSFKDRVEFTEIDFEKGCELWDAYTKNGFGKLQKLADSRVKCFRYLKEVLEAHFERFPVSGKTGRPERILAQIAVNQEKEFPEIFSEFVKQEAIYGFGDLQVRRMLEKIIQNNRQ